MKVNGQAIRAIRCAKGLNIREAATAAGLSFAYLSRVETGLKGASEETIQRVASALDVPVGAISYPDPPVVQATPETIEQIARILRAPAADVVATAS
jgi:transcriptional regulator with XRE-family HTH domain